MPYYINKHTIDDATNYRSYTWKLYSGANVALRINLQKRSDICCDAHKGIIFMHPKYGMVFFKVKNIGPITATYEERVCGNIDPKWTDYIQRSVVRYEGNFNSQYDIRKQFDAQWGEALNKNIIDYIIRRTARI